MPLSAGHPPAKLTLLHLLLLIYSVCITPVSSASLPLPSIITIITKAVVVFCFNFLTLFLVPFGFCFMNWSLQICMTSIFMLKTLIQSLWLSFHLHIALPSGSKTLEVNKGHPQPTYRDSVSFVSFILKFNTCHWDHLISMRASLRNGASSGIVFLQEVLFRLWEVNI